MVNSGSGRFTVDGKLPSIFKGRFVSDLPAASDFPLVVQSSNRDRALRLKSASGRGVFSPMDRFVRLRGGMARPLQFVASPLPSWARRIKALRKSLGLNQLDFGKGLNCSSMVISRWERGLQKPPADCLISMGKMAGPPSGWFFWKMAGIDPADAKRMLQEL